MNFNSKLFLKVSAIILFGVFILYFGYREFFPTQNNWKIEFPHSGTSSSPKAIDLTNDGVLDIVIGAGGKEYDFTENGVLALDGNSGEILWKVEGRNQMVGSANFKDITNDNIPDVFIGGRSAQLMAIDGSNGKIIWEMIKSKPSQDLVNDTSFLNFFNPLFIPDQDNDGHENILVSFGGFVKAEPEEQDRPAGYLMIVSARTGEVLVKAPTPDGKEIYFSPVMMKRYSTDFIIFGTGGETVNGGLYIISLNELLQGNLKGASKLADGEGKGFIAPAIITDITSDGQSDIVVNSVNGRMIAFDGKTLKKIWEVRIGENIETYSMPAPFNYNNDKITDFFSSYGIGKWPDIRKAIQVVIDGKSGEIKFKDNTGTFQFASPVVFDMLDDNLDNIIFPINIIQKETTSGNSLKKYLNTILVYRFSGKGEFFQFGKVKQGTNLGSTPLLTDLDHDGYLDIILCHNGHSTDFFAFEGLEIERIETKIKVKSKIKWGEYMGSNGKSIFENLSK